MSNIKNSVQLIGNIGKDLEVTTYDSGSKKLSIPIATNLFFTNNKGEKVKQTECHNVVAWGKTAELMSSTLQKGQEVAIHGKLSYRSYTDKEGQLKYVTEIIVSEFYKLSKGE
jgi:single-strand DNA-binding protein